MSAFQITVVLLFILILVRNELTWRFAKRRLADIYARHVEEINADKSPDLSEYEACNSAYLAHLFDLRRWTYRQFYPAA